jgi:cytochrome c oxidase assembly protein subunit 15
MTQPAFVRFAWSALAVTVAVIVWGAVVRATGSGAGCGSHWPLCNGAVVPLAPRAATVIEYIHRVTSGSAMLLSLGLVIGARQVFAAGHRARTWALWAFGFMLLEAALGAGLVLLGLVEDNTSGLRAAYIAVHLSNTMVLTGLMTGTIWWASRPIGRAVGPILRSQGLLFTMALTMLVAAAGGAVALGDTLFPAASLGQGLAADMSPTSHFLIRLRWIHPAMAVAVVLILMVQVRRDATFAGPDRHGIRTALVSLVHLQAGLGVINLLMLAPLPLQMAHLLGSNLLWIAMVWAWMQGQATGSTGSSGSAGS